MAMGCRSPEHARYLQHGGPEMAGHETHYTLPLPDFDQPPKLLIVVAPYYKDIADQLVAGARAEIEKAGGSMKPSRFRARWKFRPQSDRPFGCQTSTVLLH